MIAIGLAMDAFAVSLGIGTTQYAHGPRPLFRLSFHFGLFQALMPVLGWIVGARVAHLIAPIDHWIALALLAFVGVRMIRSGLDAAGETHQRDPSRGSTLVLLSIAVSIDAFAVGLSLAMLEVSIIYPVIVIGITTGCLSLFGLLAGERLGQRFGKRMEVLGGLILIAIGVQVVVSHLFAAPYAIIWPNRGRRIPQPGGKVMKQTAMHRMWGLLLAMLLAASVAGCTPLQPEDTRLKLGLIPVLDVLPVYVAEQNGYFAEQGIQVEVVPVRSAQERDVLVQTGQADGVLTDLPSTALLNKDDVRVKAIYTSRRPYPNAPMFRILAGPDTNLTAPADLKDVPIGISQNTVIEYLTDRILKAEGLSRGPDRHRGSWCHPGALRTTYERQPASGHPS